MIDVGTLDITKEHVKKVVEALTSGRLSYGPMTDEFEKKMSKIHKNKYGIMTNSGTSALQAAIHALKILNNWKNGDEIIMPATTFVATYNVILQNNMKPVLVDVDEFLNIDVERIDEKITKRTRAIMPVHLLGKPVNMEHIMIIAKEHDLKVIEDSCETMLVPGVGKGDVTCFSFYVAHLITTGVGGMAITKDKKLAELIRSLIFHGRDNKYLNIDDDDTPKKEVIEARFKFNYPGYSSRSTELEAALGLVELENYDWMIKQRQDNAKYLNKGLRDTFTYDFCGFDSEYFKNNACMMYPYFHPDRDKLMLYLEKHGVMTRTIMPLINQPYIKVKRKDYPVSNIVLDHGLLVGCHQNLGKDDLDRIINLIQKFDKT